MRLELGEHEAGVCILERYRLIYEIIYPHEPSSSALFESIRVDRETQRRD